MNAVQKQYLHEHLIEEITSKLTKAVVYVDTNTSLEDTCKMMGKNDISAVPILDVNSNSFVGMIDIVDIAHFISYTYEQKRKSTQEGSELHLFKDVKAVDLLSISEEGKLMYTFSPKMSLDCVLEPFSKGIHRALITTEGDRKYHILSQGDIVKFLFESGQFDDWFAKPMMDIPALFQYKSPVASISSDSPAIEGFKKLGRNNFGAIAVKDADGTLIGNLSASDLRGVAVDFLIRTILRPARQFLQLVHGIDDADPVTSKLEDSLGSVVKKLHFKHMHRVWIVDGQGKIDTLVSFSDICRVFTDVY